ncbi:hypothetical protein HN011_004648 [Eciton burchellii]|nr:hypothetical protein HN011_004648 [Eciton burchellii]
MVISPDTKFSRIKLAALLVEDSLYLDFYSQLIEKYNNQKMRFGPRHARLAVKWLPTTMVYGTGATIAMLYFTDWKTVLQYLPIYNTKYQ